MAIAFTSPTIARTGLGYAQLVEENRNFVQGCADFEHQGRARIMNTAKGLIKLYADAADGKLLGAEMFAPDAEHLVHLLAWAVDAGMHIKDMLTLPYYHPVLEEGLRSAVRDAASQLHPPVTASRLMRCDDNPVA